MSERPPIAIFASGRGSNFDAIIEAVQGGQLSADVRFLFSDRPDAPVLSRAAEVGVKTHVLRYEADRFDSREEYDREVLSLCQKEAVRFVVLAGYKRIVSSVLIEGFRSERGYSRIVNIHPSLLPAFPGLGSYQKAFDYGVKHTGVTIHLVEEEVDSGPICAQAVFDLEGCRGEQDVELRGLKIEHQLYPQTLQWVLQESFKTEERKGRLCVSPD